MVIFGLLESTLSTDNNGRPYPTKIPLRNFLSGYEIGSLISSELCLIRPCLFKPKSNQRHLSLTIGVARILSGRGCNFLPPKS